MSSSDDTGAPGQPGCIRQLTIDDAAAYRATLLEALASHPEAFTSSHAEREREPLRWWQARLTDRPSNTQRVFGAFDEHGADGALLGFAGLRVETGERTNHRALLFGMYVIPAARRLGLGSRLVETIIEEATERPRLRVIRLTVSEQNAEARALYNRLGFIEFGREPMAVRNGKGFTTKLHLYRLLR